MIATTSSGQRFAALARYLLRGRSGEATERVAWTAGRNLGLDDPELAAVVSWRVGDQLASRRGRSESTRTGVVGDDSGQR